jgi:ABC-type bacteriocin/lantibiotic exporter with double-glycine peptidase domain
MTGAELLNIHIVRILVDSIVDANGERALRMVGWLLCMALLTVCGTAARKYAEAVAGQRSLVSLRRGIYQKILRLSPIYFEGENRGRVESLVVNDIPALQEFYTHTVFEIVTNGTLLLAAYAILITIDRQLAALAIILQPLSIIIAQAFRKTTAQAAGTVQGQLQNWLRQITETVNGFKDILTHGVADHERGRADGVIQDVYRVTMRREGVRRCVSLLSVAVVSLLNVLGLWVAVTKVLNGTITLGTMVAYMSYRGWVSQPVQLLSRAAVDIQLASGIGKRLAEFTDEPQYSMEGVIPVNCDFSIEFDEVCFSYDSSQPVLDNVSFRVGKGETVAIVGASASGKTTMAKLLLGFLTPQTGEIRFCGVSIGAVNKRWLWDRCGLVLQDAYLFDRSVRENVTMGLFGDDPGLAEAALDSVGWTLSEGEDRGRMLSGGERQRVLLARALFKDPEVVILDEAVSAIDVQAESEIWRNLRTLRDKTVLFITHRPSSLEQADRVIFINRQHKVISGGHQELLATCIEYRDLLTSPAVPDHE